MRRILLVTMLISSLCIGIWAQETAAPSAPPPAGRTVYAAVGKEKVFEDEIAARVQEEVIKRPNMPESGREAMTRYLRQRAATDLVQEACLANAAGERGLTPDAAAIDKALAAERDEQGGEAKWREWMKSTGRTEEMRRDAARRRAAIAMLKASVPDPSEAEISAYFEKRRSQFAKEDSVTASHILVKVEPTATKEERDAQRHKIEEIRSRIVAGESFADLARQYSDDSSNAGKGGSLGTFGREAMVKPFEDAAFALKTGELSQVVETQFGYHLILCQERQPAVEPTREGAREKIVTVLRNEATLRLIRELSGNCHPVFAKAPEATPAPAPPVSSGQQSH